MLIISAFILFCLAGVVGVFPMRSLFKGVPAKWRFLVAHGVLAVTGLILLILQATQPGPTPVFGLMLLIMTAFGGLLIFTLRRLKAPIPPGFALVHPFVGLFGLALLVLFMLTGEG